MSGPTYSWRKGFPVKCDPQLVGTELEELYRRHGAVTPDLLVEHAQDEDSALHGYFTWDDDEAAIRWRRQQGRQILNSIRITQVGESEPRVMNVAIRLAEAGNVYQKATVAVHETTLWAQVMIDTLKDLAGVEKRLEDLYAIESGVRQRSVAEIRVRIGAAREAVEESARVQ